MPSNSKIETRFPVRGDRCRDPWDHDPAEDVAERAALEAAGERLGAAVGVTAERMLAERRRLERLRAIRRRKAPR